MKVCAVVGFPLGAGTPNAKAFEAREAVRCGADEIDMVLNIGALKSRDYEMVARDIRAVVRVTHAHPRPALVKVIIEAALLTDDRSVVRSPVMLLKLLPSLYSPCRWQPMQVLVHDEWHDAQSMRSVWLKPSMLRSK